MVDLEEELQCSICSELYIEPCVLNCGHLFCKSCINEWKRKKKVCPMCRAKISSCVRMPLMDAIIEKNVLLLSNEAKERRKSAIKDRSNESSTPAKKRKRCSHHRHRQPLVAFSSPTPLFGLRPAQFDIPPPAIPSTSHDTNALNQMMQIPVSLDNTVPLDLSEPDPFAWAARSRVRRHEPMVALDRNSPVTVAAVDLTDMSSSLYLNIPNVDTRVQTRSSTESAANATIDLTSL